MTRTQLLLPLTFRAEPIESLLVCSLRADPELAMIEIQAFDDQLHGHGVLVILYRRDRKVDVFRSPGITVDPGSYVLQAGLNRFVEAEFRRQRVAISDAGVDVDVCFRDVAQREVAVRINEPPGGVRHAVPFLAPVGAEIDEPRRLFLAFMSRFDFVRRHGTSIEIRVGNRNCRPVTLPIPIDLRRVYFARYARDIVVAVLNPDGEGARWIDAEPGIVDVDGAACEVVTGTGGGAALAAMTAENAGGRARLRFDPPFPDLASPAAKAAHGSWRIDVDGERLVTGAYTIQCNQTRAVVELEPTVGWQPRHLKPSLSSLTYVVPRFRNWPKTYRWRGEITLTAEPVLHGHWTRRQRQNTHPRRAEAR